MTHLATIRVARSNEFEAIGKLTALAYTDVLTDGDDDAYLSVLLDAAGRARDAELLVAVDNTNALLGTVTVGRPGTPLAEIARITEVEVRMLAVAPEHAGRGIGRSLMDRVHALADNEGFTGTVLSVISTNVDAARFYQRLGYERAAERDWYPLDDMSIALQIWTKSLVTTTETKHFGEKRGGKTEELRHDDA